MNISILRMHCTKNIRIAIKKFQENEKMLEPQITRLSYFILHFILRAYPWRDTPFSKRDHTMFASKFTDFLVSWNALVERKQTTTHHRVWLNCFTFYFRADTCREFEIRNRLTMKHENPKSFLPLQTSIYFYVSSFRSYFSSVSALGAWFNFRVALFRMTSKKSKTEKRVIFPTMDLLTGHRRKRNFREVHSKVFEIKVERQHW